MKPEAQTAPKGAPESVAAVRKRWPAWRIVLLMALGIGLALSLYGRLPGLEDRTESAALTRADTASTVLGLIVGPRAAQHPGKSGFVVLDDPWESFAARVALARAAERTLDVQYYIWQGDTTGQLLMQALLEAAQRGVRVRLLIDDNGVRGIDDKLVALDAQDNLEVRLFNPFVIRRFKEVGFLYDFQRLNRRMHNKSFTADSQASIVGGRNVGDEYFGAADGFLKVDLDVMLAGPIVDTISLGFDAYWASDSAYPVARIASSVSPPTVERELAAIASTSGSPAAAVYLKAVVESGFVASLAQGGPDLLWADVSMVADHPGKGLKSKSGHKLLINQLDAMLAVPERSLVLVSPYFVPGKLGTDAFIALASRGVDVRVLTNSLEATDVTPVHAGYSKRRRALLEAGVRLFEMKRFSEKTKRHASAGPFGSSASSLHAKTFAVDSERAFVGSFNLDPRSIHLNTELGFVIESPELARQIQATFDQVVPQRAYEARLDDEGELYWLERHGEDIERLDDEPNSGWLVQAAVTVLGWLPIEWLL